MAVADWSQDSDPILLEFGRIAAALYRVAMLGILIWMRQAEALSHWQVVGYLYLYLFIEVEFGLTLWFYLLDIPFMRHVSLLNQQRHSLPKDLEPLPLKDPEPLPLEDLEAKRPDVVKKSRTARRPKKWSLFLKTRALNSDRTKN